MAINTRVGFEVVGCTKNVHFFRKYLGLPNLRV